VYKFITGIAARYKFAARYNRAAHCKRSLGLLSLGVKIEEMGDVYPLNFFE
jgi:hypothetical protein